MVVPSIGQAGVSSTSHAVSSATARSGKTHIVPITWQKAKKSTSAMYCISVRRIMGSPIISGKTCVAEIDAHTFHQLQQARQVCEFTLSTKEHQQCHMIEEPNSFEITHTPKSLNKHTEHLGTSSRVPIEAFWAGFSS